MKAFHFYNEMDGFTYYQGKVCSHDFEKVCTLGYC